MLVLFETAAGYAVFKLLDEKKLTKSDDLFKDFKSPEAASGILKLKQFTKFKDMADALSAATALIEGKMGKTLKSMLKKLVAKDAQETLLVADAKLGNIIKAKTKMDCVSNSHVQELMRCIRSQMSSLLTGLPTSELSAMSLGLAHSLSRYKLKFSPDKVDTMIVQAISLLDDLDKELNNYVMRAREWYGWHFPELGKIVTDNLAFAKVAKNLGDRTRASELDFSGYLPEEVEEEVKQAAEISMGTEISEQDILNISYLCDQIIEITEYRAQLYDYLKNRMMAIAPNLTILVGELVGARLISHAGSLMNLAKHPSSTVQILGAEKALFRALKTKHDTPKYGLIYHATLVGQSNPKIKGKISRMLAAKASLAIRVDALGDDNNTDVGVAHLATLERKLKFLEEGGNRKYNMTPKSNGNKFDKYTNKSEIKPYNNGFDSTLNTKKRDFDDNKTEDEPKAKKLKKIKSESESENDEPKAKKQKKIKSDSESENDSDEPKVKKSKKNKKNKKIVEEIEESPKKVKKVKKSKKEEEVEEEVEVEETPKKSKKEKKNKKEVETPKSEKKKKKKSKSDD